MASFMFSAISKPAKAKILVPANPSQRRIYWMNRLKVMREDGTQEELHPTPEVIAVAIAKCSRTETPFDQNIDDVTLEKAAEFHEKWVVGYGHGSVAEHAVSSVGIENISQVAIKVLEDTRLASFTEKSSRYQVFSRERAFVPDTIRFSPIADTYQLLLKHLYDLYEELFPRMADLMRNRFPKTADLTEKAYEAQTKARALDVVRCLLPAASLSSLGMTANARVWGHVISKCLSHPLEEVRAIGTELRNVLKGEPEMNPDLALQERPHPTLLKYAEPKSYLQETPANLQEIAASLFKNPNQTHGPTTIARSVTLVQDDAFAEVRIAAALLTRVSHVPYAEIFDRIKTDHELCEQVITTSLIKRGAHEAVLREFEHAVFQHEIVMDYGAWRDIQRHRMCTQTNQPLSVHLGYGMPEEIETLGYQNQFIQVMQEAARVYEAMIVHGLTNEAEYAVPMAYRRRLLVTWNLRELFHFIELRSGIKGHPSYRKIAQELWRTLDETHPFLAKFINVDMRGNEATVSTLGAKPRGI
ncbi:MAG TPA: FAD-dependent thymidylate synthase [Patescibacteria group bacterium]|nr:FAD-dependent thymidylate synthase [Patescibacteria group bacterium]